MAGGIPVGTRGCEVSALGECADGGVDDSSGGGGQVAAADSVPAVAGGGMALAAGWVPATAGGVNAISKDTSSGVGGAIAGGAVLNPLPLDGGSSAHVTLLE